MGGMSHQPRQRYGVDPNTDGEFIRLCLLALCDSSVLETAIQSRGVTDSGKRASAQ